MIAIKNNPNSLQYISENLKNNYRIVKTAISLNALVYKYASIELRNNNKLALIAIAQTSTILSILSNKLRNGGLEDYIKRVFAEKYPLNMETFKSTILFGSININKNIKTTNHIYKLCHLGTYASIDIKKLIGEYAGLQYGTQWQILKKAAQNMNLKLIQQKENMKLSTPSSLKSDCHESLLKSCQSKNLMESVNVNDNDVKARRYKNIDPEIGVCESLMSLKITDD
mmetsp:Transcript_12279/g.14823  ORF Transcript_12279/g.14823 Transcript_12279/m.14823 type:complete len:227 (+) Transcript_12279:1-681(+)